MTCHFICLVRLSHLNRSEYFGKANGFEEKSKSLITGSTCSPYCCDDDGLIVDFPGYTFGSLDHGIFKVNVKVLSAPM